MKDGHSPSFCESPALGFRPSAPAFRALSFPRCRLGRQLCCCFQLWERFLAAFFFSHAQGAPLKDGHSPAFCESPALRVHQSAPAFRALSFPRWDLFYDSFLFKKACGILPQADFLLALVKTVSTKKRIIFLSPLLCDVYTGFTCRVETSSARTTAECEAEDFRSATPRLVCGFKPPKRVCRRRSRTWQGKGCPHTEIRRADPERLLAYPGFSAAPWRGTKSAPQ